MAHLDLYNFYCRMFIVTVVFLSSQLNTHTPTLQTPCLRYSERWKWIINGLFSAEKVANSITIFHEFLNITAVSALYQLYPEALLNIKNSCLKYK